MTKKCEDCKRRFDDGRGPEDPPSRRHFCEECAACHRATGLGRSPGGIPKKYFWKDEHDAYLRAHYHGGLRRRAEVIDQLIRLTGFPRYVIKKRAAFLGLSLHNETKRPWQPREVAVLGRLVGKLAVRTIAKRLKRTEASVALKFKRMKISRRVRNGYTMRDLEACLGEDHHKVERWVAQGWLVDHRQGTVRHNGNGNDIHRFRERDLLNFLRSHPNEINLGKVDHVWFMDLVLLKGREASAQPVRDSQAEED
jgi:hypothetical protein